MDRPARKGPALSFASCGLPYRITSCAIGVRAYNAVRFLMQAGFTDVSVYPADAAFWRTPYLDVAARTEELMER